MYLIDTNIFLEILLDRENKESCKKFLIRVEKGEIVAIITTFALHSIAIILEKLKGLKAYGKFLKTILNFEGLRVYSTTLIDDVK